MAMQIAYQAIYRHAPQITVSRQEAYDLRFFIVFNVKFVSQRKGGKRIPESIFF
jgi:hypothetical protein